MAPGELQSGGNADCGADSDLHSPEAQIVSWLRFSIASGRFFAGSNLPSIRKLSERTGVNVNTVHAAYAELERQGLVTMRHGSGSFVSDDVRPMPALEIIATAAVEQARAAGIGTEDLVAAIETAARESVPVQGSLIPDGSAGDSEAAQSLELRSRLGIVDLNGPDEGGRVTARRELRRQITFLESLLSTRDDDAPSTAANSKGRGGPPRIADIDDLQETRDQLLRRLDQVRSRTTRDRRANGPTVGHPPA